MDTFQHFLIDTRHTIQQHGPAFEHIVRDVGNALEELLSSEPVDAESQAAPGDYHGRLLFEDPVTGYIAVLMTWGPGACTSIHDHGTWGVFGVCHGRIEFTNFVRMDETHVRPVACFEGGPGDVSYVIPPAQEIHQIRNPGAGVARSIHIYGRNIGF